MPLTPGDISDDIRKARRLILKLGWNTTSYQILNPGIRRWFSANEDSVVGYVSAAGVRVVAGAPVCAAERLPEIIEEFENDAARTAERVCYLAAEARLESVLKNSGRHARVLLGAQPVWNPAGWPDIVSGDKSLRAQINRARNKGVTVSEWPLGDVFDNPRLTEVVGLWLSRKGLPPLHFMVEPDTLTRIFDRRVFVAERNGEVDGFVLLSPIATRNGFLIEQFIHRPGAPNGTIELLIDTAMRTLGRDGFEYATLGLSPLSTRARIDPFENPLWLRILLETMRRYARGFYNFDGLDAFKSKLRPESWEPIFAIYNRPQFSPRTLYAVASAFSRNKPVRMMLGGIGRVALLEAERLKRRIQS